MTRFNTFMHLFKLESLHNCCTEHGHMVTYPKGTALVEEGNICRYIGIIQSGYFKYVAINTRGEECVTGFTFAGEIASDFIQSFLFNKPAKTTVIAGCDTQVLQISIPEAKLYFAKHDPDFVKRSCRVLLEEAYRRYLDSYLKTPAERYTELRNRTQMDLDLIPHKELASYLNISRRQFQRIRDNF
ncbi:MAG: Crp/Fnr family transcriptional regulator [Paramuribaculum sp.]|nr:Crp/Fnr family transcriptional regulator [Paramuribaculum sp.]